MSMLVLTLRESPAIPIDCSPLTPDKLSGKSCSEIAKIGLQSGNRKVPTGEVFDISGKTGESLSIKNSSDKLDRVGSGMKGGAIEIQGNVGSYLAADMVNGSIRVSGDAGILAATGMAAGLLHIRGNAGDFLGAAIAGNKQGMLGGVVIVDGNAGDRTGDHMRRGIILIGGNVGDYCGSRMLAGTILVKGMAGRLPGYAMKRGTLLLTGSPQLPATFNDCGTHDLMFLRLFARHLKQIDSAALPFTPQGERVRRFVGDRANGGVGEILVVN